MKKTILPILGLLLICLFITCSKDKTDEPINETKSNKFSLNITYEPDERGGWCYPGAGEYEKGTEVVIYAVERDNNNFIEFKGDLQSSNDTIVITMDKDINLVAVFELGDIDQDGLCDYDDYCDNTPLGATINEEGCSTDQYYDIGTDLESYLKYKGYDIGVTDGKISEDILDQVHDIKIDNLTLEEENIITYFKNVRRLTLNNVHFDHLDLTQMSDLEEVIIGEFGDVSNIGSLDLSKLTSLRKLSVNLNKKEIGVGNKLNAINLEGCTLLSYLKIRGTSLQEVDLTGLINLKEIELSYTPFTSLNLDQAPNLKEIYFNHCDLEVQLIDNPKLENVRIENTKIVGINAANLPKLNELWLESNDLTELDLSQNSSIEFLYCQENALESVLLGNNQSLNRIRIANASLTNIDVTGLTQLESLYITESELAEIDFSNLTKLKYINLNKNKLAVIDVSDCTSLRELTFQSNLVESLIINPVNEIRILSPRDNKLKSLDVSFLNLSHLNCSLNDLTCIKVNEEQLNQKIDGWTKDDDAVWSLDCGGD